MNDPARHSWFVMIAVPLCLATMPAHGEEFAMPEVSWETDAEKISDDAYCRVEGDHLVVDNQRVRYWGHIGHFPDPVLKEGRLPRRDLELMADRMVDLGFNLHRLWHSADNPDYTPGDNSRSDLRDYGYYLLKKNNVKVWHACLNHVGVVEPERDVGVIDDPETADEWKAAIDSMRTTHYWSEGKKVTGLGRNLARRWDPRLKKLALRRMKERATHFNKYTRMRYCDDPNIVVWELANEEWWVQHMLAGQWQKLPRFFKEQLLSHWHAFLEEKYGDEQGLTKSWGFLLEGESLEHRTILLAPMRDASRPATINDPNRLIENAFKGSDDTYARKDFTDQRASDVLEFFTRMVLRNKKEEEKAFRTWGKSCRLGPLLYDTGIGSQIQCTYLHSRFDAVTQCTYVNGQHHVRDHKRFPFNSALENVPRVCWDVPWVEHNRIKGKPFFVYETQIKTTAKYRAEFPMEMAALGSIQDWDIINWHSYGPGPDATQERPNERPIEVGSSLSLHYSGDEVQLSAMRAASEIFCDVALKPVENPTTFVFGRKALYHPNSFDYAGSFMGLMNRVLLPTTFLYGCQLVIDPKLEDNPEHPLFAGGDGKPDQGRFRQFLNQGYLAIGEQAKLGIFPPNPIAPTEQIVYDWKNSFLAFDAPGVAMYTGFFGELDTPDKKGFAFDNGVILKKVRVHNPEGMPYPVTPEERYVTFALAAADGKSLAECDSAILSLVSTSFNSGYALDTEQEPREFFGVGIKETGTLPVLVARVSAVIRCPALKGMNYTFYDFEMNPIDKGKIRGNKLRIPANQPIFYTELTRP